MSVLLRHPASVPALFSGALEPESPVDRTQSLWRRVARSAPFGLVATWAAMVLIEVPLVKVGAAAASLALPR